MEGNISVDLNFRTRLGNNEILAQKPAQLLGTVWLGDGTLSPEPRVMGPSSTTASASTLILPLYTALPSSLGTVNGGYGAVGLLPYALHRAACSPPLLPSPGIAQWRGALAPDSYTPPLNQASTVIGVEYYGNVQLPGYSLVEVQHQYYSFGAQFQSRSNLFYFRIDLNPSQQRIHLSRDPTLQESRPLVDPFPFDTVTARHGGFFRISNGPDLANFLPSTEETTLYFYTVECGSGGDPNPADVAGGIPSGPDGIVDGNDFVAFIKAFAAGEPLADVAGNDPWGPDGVIDGGDFVAFINAFGAGCD